MVTLADLLGTTGLALAPVAVADPDVEIRWVATSELPDPTPYLQGGEVLLTTGLETRGWRSQWRGYVDRLAAADVAALGLGVGLTHRRAPAGLVSACRRAGLNLFEVPRPTPFVSVSRAAATLLDDERDRVARRSLDAQRALTRAALAADAVPALLATLADQVGGAAATVDRDGRTLAGVGSLDADAVQTEVARIRDRGLHAAASVSGEEGTTIVQPLGVRSAPDRWLAVSLPGRPTEVQRATVAGAVSLLGLALERELERRTDERRLHARALELVLAGDTSTAQVLLDDRPTLPARVRVLRVDGPADDALAVLEAERVLAANVDGTVVALSAARRAASVGRRLGERGLRVGIGSVEPLARAADSHAAATVALAGASVDDPVRRWDTPAREGVAGLLDPARVRAFARAYLAPLADEPALLATLTTYLRRHGSLLATAEELAVHRNTVRNRLVRIESLLGVSLDDPQVRVDAWVALHSR